MAILQSDQLSFEFNYTGFEHGWVQYQFYFRWQEENIIKDSVLKRWNAYWDNRPDGAFLANEGGQDGLIPFLKQILANDKADHWTPIEPDIVIAVYSEQYFPFLPSHYTLVYESEEYRAEKEERNRLRQEKGKLPDDHFTFIVLVDAYNLKDASAYYGQGISLQLVVTRQDLEGFLAQLEMEYRVFRKQFGLDEDKPEN